MILQERLKCSSHAYRMQIRKELPCENSRWKKWPEGSGWLSKAMRKVKKDKDWEKQLAIEKSLVYLEEKKFEGQKPDCKGLKSGVEGKKVEAMSVDRFFKEFGGERKEINKIIVWEDATVRQRFFKRWARYRHVCGQQKQNQWVKRDWKLGREGGGGSAKRR